MKKPHPIDIHVGQRLRTIRTLRGLSQETLGRKVGLTFQQIQKYERGTNRIAASRLYELADILEISIIDFYEGLDSLPHKKYLPQFTKEELLWLKALHSIKNHKIKRKLSDFILTIVGELKDN